MRQRPFCRGWIKMRETGGVTDGRRPMLDVNVIVDNDGSWLSAMFFVRSAVTCHQLTAIINKKASYHKWSMFSLVQLISGHKLLVMQLSVLYCWKDVSASTHRPQTPNKFVIYASEIKKTIPNGLPMLQSHTNQWFFYNSATQCATRVPADRPYRLERWGGLRSSQAKQQRLERR